ncbi:MAG TPA: hypothetical protein VGB68_03640 [Pyrinomonadaceae bacterium]|jgi:hypothetical protein
MVRQTNSKIVREIDKLNENETLAVLDYISQLLSSRQLPIPSETQFNDDLIASLSEKRENRCAQQVLEWEKTRRRGHYQRAA